MSDMKKPMEFEVTYHDDMVQQTHKFIRVVSAVKDISESDRKSILQTLSWANRCLDENDYLAWRNAMNMAAKTWAMI